MGLGGGFIIVPVLRLFFGLNPAMAAGTSLALVIANSGSGAITYLLQKRVQVRTGLSIAAGGLPGSILGAIISNHISARIFDWAFAGFLLLVAADMVLHREQRLKGRDENPARSSSGSKGMPWPRALVAGFGVGFISALFGVGGGVAVVPTLFYFSDLPAHAISATSHFAIALTSPIGFIAHVVQGDVDWRFVVPLVVGGLLGGPAGARLSLRLRSPLLLGLVAVALTVAALALIVRHFLP